MRRQVILSLVLIAALLSGGAGAMYLLIKTKPRPPERQVAPPPLAVRALKLLPQATIEPIVGYGTAQADRQAWIAVQVAGEVVHLADDLRAGSAVREGQLLVRIDDREYRATLDRARSQLAADQAALRLLDVEEQNLTRLAAIAQEELAVAERELNRTRDLLERGSSNPREADQARLQFEQARRTLQALVNQQALLPQRRAQQQATCDLRRAEVAMAQLNLERCSIVAPFSGQLDVVDVEFGEHVVPGSQLLSIVDPVHIEVPVELPVSLRGRVQVGRPARLSLESHQDVFWTGLVARVAPSANQLTRTFAMFLEVDNSQQPEPLIPGVFVHAQIDGPQLENALVVPRGCIQDGRVYVCRDGQAFQQAVRVQRHLSDRAIVRGLDPGQVVITSNLDALYDGAPVRVLLDEPAAEPSATTQPTVADRPAPSQAHSSVKTP